MTAAGTQPRIALLANHLLGHLELHAQHLVLLLDEVVVHAASQPLLDQLVLLLQHQRLAAQLLDLQLQLADPQRLALMLALDALQLGPLYFIVLGVLFVLVFNRLQKEFAMTVGSF